MKMFVELDTAPTSISEKTNQKKSSRILILCTLYLGVGLTATCAVRTEQ